MKKYFFIIALFFVFSTQYVNAEVPVTTGFIPGQIWYSKEPLVEGETVKIYTVVWNGDASPLSAHVEFFDKNVILGSKDIIVKSMQLKDVSVSWQITSGDHTISAKITSSKLTSGSGVQSVTLDRNTTAEDKKFVPVTVKVVEGESASSADVIKNQVTKATSTIDGIIPDSVSKPVSSAVDSFDAFRSTSYTEIAGMKDETQSRIDEIIANEKIALESNQSSVDKTSTTDKNTKKVKSGTVITPKESKVLDGTEKPIAYIKLFLLSVLAFIMGNKIVFYGLCIALVLLILRLIYRKIKNR